MALLRTPPSAHLIHKSNGFNTNRFSNGTHGRGHSFRGRGCGRYSNKCAKLPKWEQMWLKRLVLKLSFVNIAWASRMLGRAVQKIVPTYNRRMHGHAKPNPNSRVQLGNKFCAIFRLRRLLSLRQGRSNHIFLAYWREKKEPINRIEDR
ncbi:unnamed protein product [Dovyalis caffra]|uniref:Uncharacterized protein n=1 Tax=Dovyalis caffra TaxID=77055 RepID=A0AAV1RQR6_9ROSI|nr:unnamed protein product [Dovyalis caffra]